MKDLRILRIAVAVQSVADLSHSFMVDGPSDAQRQGLAAVDSLLAQLIQVLSRDENSQVWRQRVHTLIADKRRFCG